MWFGVKSKRGKSIFYFSCILVHKLTSHISVKNYPIKQSFFFTKIYQIKKLGGDGRCNSHDFQIFEKNVVEPGGNWSIRNIAKILQKAPVFIRLEMTKVLESPRKSLLYKPIIQTLGM
eukprot:UN24578